MIGDKNAVPGVLVEADTMEEQELLDRYIDMQEMEGYGLPAGI